MDIEEKQNWLSHLTDLKYRLSICLIGFIIASIISYFFAQEIYLFLIRPLADLIENPTQRRFIFTNLTEVFFTYLRLSLFVGFIISFPLIVSQIYLFAAPGLYKNEKKIFLPILILSPALFVLGAIFVYYLIFPVAWKFFLSFEYIPHDSIPILLEAKVAEYLSLTTSLIIAFGLAFQLPVVLVAISIFGLIDSKWLQKKRKIAIIFIFIIAAIITPPDVVSQISVALPMLLLYEVALIICKYFEKKKWDSNA